jgi:hypothetical protein
MRRPHDFVSHINGAAPDYSAVTEIEGRKAVGTGKRDKQPSRPSPNSPQVWSLRYGDALTPIALVVPDNHWPGMYRMHWPDGRVSDMANLARCRDAGTTLCERGSPERNWRLFHRKLNVPEKPRNPVSARLEALVAGRAA